MRQVLKAFAKNTVFANIIFVMIVVAGLVAAGLMYKESFPEFSLDAIQVTVVYPGADPEEVEEGVCRKIEEAIDGVEGIKQYTTTAAENVGSAWIEVNQRYRAEDVLKRVRSRIDAVSTFPPDAEKPITEEFLLRDRTIFLTVSGQMPERQLKDLALDVKREIERLPAVSQVDLTGDREYELGIEVSEKHLRQYALTLSQVADAIRRSNLNLAGGTLRTEGEEIRLRTIGRRYTGDELSQIIVIAQSGGESITLGQIATIRDGFAEDPRVMRANGKRAMGLWIMKTKQEDAIKISRAVEDYVAAKQSEMPPNTTLRIVYNTTPTMLEARIRLLIKNGAVGLGIVFLLLWLFLDIRLSFWAGMGIPITLAGALVILWAIGGTINMISLFGLIMVLGIVVDDAIVVGEAIYVHRRRGKPPLRAAVDGVCEVALPVIGAVTTTIVAFLPLAYISGIMGKFIRILPIVVIACLVVSLVECLIILPAHLSHLPDPDAEPVIRNPFQRRAQALKGWLANGLDYFVKQIYAPVLTRSMKYAYVSLAASIMIFLLTVGLAAGGILKFEVFPKLDGFVVTSTVEFPAGTPPEVTAEAVAKMEASFREMAKRQSTLSGKPLIENTLSLVGGTLDDQPKSGPHLGSVQVVLLPSEERGIHSDDLLVKWEEELGHISGAETVSFNGMAGGLPGAPIEIWIQGDDMAEVMAAVEATKARLSHYAGVYQVQSDFRAGKNEMHLRLKPEARALGLTVNDLARQVHAGFYGEEALRLQRGRDDVKIKVRYPADERKSLSAVNDVRIRTPKGVEVPLGSVAEISFAPGYSTITRTDGMRRVSVSAEIDTTKANAAEISADLQKTFFRELEKKHRGIFVSLQGEDKNTRESFSSLAFGYPLAILGIIVIIATILRSYVQPLVIIFIVPFGIVGAFLGHFVMGLPLSMMSMFGIVALSGVVVNDAIVLIESINANLAEGMPFLDAVKEGCVRRFRPVFLTSVSTVGGLMPMILEKDMQATVLIPMALAIAAGVAFATVLTLLLIPSLLIIVNDLRRVLHRVRHGNWPTREEVEPATRRNCDEPVEEMEQLCHVT